MILSPAENIKPPNLGSMICAVACGSAFGSLFMISAPVGKNRHLAVARIALALQGLQRSGLELLLRCAAVVK